MTKALKSYFILLTLFLFTTTTFSQEIALTFDDAPTGDSPSFKGIERTQRIINHLKTHGVEQVAFFIITQQIDSTGKIRLKKYSDAGHLLANHTRAHRWIKDIGSKKYIDDITYADSILRKMPGFMPWFRYPYLDEGKTKGARDSIRIALQKLQLTNGYTTIDDYDWYLNSLLRQAVENKRNVNLKNLKAVYIEHIWNSIQFYDKIAQQSLKRSPKHILLLHENDLAAYFLGDLISFLKEKGWKIISPVEAYKDPIASHTPDVLFNGQGRVAAIAYEKGVAAKQLVQESEDELYLDELIKIRQVFK